MRRRLATLALALLLLAGASAPAWAGGSPETTVVAVPADAPLAREVAWRWAARRGLPPSHVVLLDDVPTDPVVGVEAFRERILRPLLAALEDRGLLGHVDTIAYAPGFPYGVDFQADAAAQGFEIRPPISRIASLTGLTFLYGAVLEEDARVYLDLHGNGYHRRVGSAAPPARPPTAAERAHASRAAEALAAGDHAAAAEAFERLLATYPAHAPSWYNLACCYARLDRPDDALEALGRAVEAGWRDAAHTDEDPDLAPLRERPAFGRLLERMRSAVPDVQPTRAFDPRVAWTGEDEPGPAVPSGHADRHLLAVMLGWTGAHGTSTDDVLAYLERAAASDGTRPEGTVYLLENGDVRARTRMPVFPTAASTLAALGRRAEIVSADEDGQDGRVPRGRDDVIGIVAGTASFRWQPDDPLLLPGALAEHLTSFGAHFGTPGQTKCTTFLQHGAAGTSGTVAEPYAIAEKFPSPLLHVHYARGCSVAEAFHQSVAGPYQLLVLGDPLARPFATFADVAIEPPDEAEMATGPVALRATVTGPAPARLELWVDGRPLAQAPPDEPLVWPEAARVAGSHDVRIVAVEDGPIATRSVGRLAVVVPGEAELDVRWPDEPVAYDEAVTLAGRAEGGDVVALEVAGRRVATADVRRGRWRLEAPAADLGPGPVPTAVLLEEDGRPVARRTGRLDVLRPPAREAPGPAEAEDALLLPGLLARWEGPDDKAGEMVVGTLGAGQGRRLVHDLELADARGARRLEMTGYLVLADTHLAELVVDGDAEVRVSLGETVVLDTAAGARRALVHRSAGRHPLRIEMAGAELARTEIRWEGTAGAGPLRGGALVHRPPGTAAAPAPEAVLPDATLGDGTRTGDGVAIGAEGVELSWTRTVRDVVGVVLHAGADAALPTTPDGWVVELRRSSRGRWYPADDLRVVLGPPPAAPGREGAPPPRYVRLAFDDERARAIRIRPADPDASFPLTKVEVLVESRR